MGGRGYCILLLLTLVTGKCYDDTKCIIPCSPSVKIKAFDFEHLILISLVNAETYILYSMGDHSYSPYNLLRLGGQRVNGSMFILKAFSELDFG